MGWSQHTTHVVIVGRVLVTVGDGEADRSAGGHPFENARQQCDGIAFPTGGYYIALSGATAVELALYSVEVEFKT